MKCVLTFSLVCLLISIGQALALAQSSVVTDLMKDANQLYEAGQFDEAAAVYQSLIDVGLEDGALFFNLGNAYFKQEDWGQAILNYRRAQRLMPRDPDVRANLALVRLQTIDQIDTQGEGLLSRLTKLAQQWLTLNEMAVATLALWFVLIILLITFWRLGQSSLKQEVFYLLIVVAILLVGGLFSLGGRLYVENVRPDGVIMAEEIEVMSGPGSQYIVEFSLHNGTEVSILEERSNWTRLALTGGQLQGWVPASAVEAVVK